LKGVGGFFDKSIYNTAWAEDARAMYRQIAVMMADRPQLGFPETATGANVLAWLDALTEPFADQLLNRYHRSGAADVLGLQYQHTELFVKNKEVNTLRHDMADILVIGRLDKTDQDNASVSTNLSEPDPWQKEFTQLAYYVRDHFVVQPFRLFFPAFLLSGAELQMFIFDRSGAYSSTIIKMSDDPECFIMAMLGYLLMTQEELGANIPSVGYQDFPKLLKQPNTIACRAATCYNALDGKHIVKFSWPEADCEPEATLLARAAGIRGIPKLVESHEFPGASVREIRSGLVFEELVRRKLKGVIYRTWQRPSVAPDDPDRPLYIDRVLRCVVLGPSV
jgi:hypothetical protein